VGRASTAGLRWLREADVTSHRIRRLLQWLIIANLAIASILAIGGDVKNAMLGLIGAAFFGLALLVGEMGDA
jgi:hypothetical protein